MSQSETDIQKQVIDWLKSQGIFVIRIPVGGVRHAGIRKASPLRGFPDLLCIIPNTKGRLLAIEIKTDSGRLSKIQEEMIFNLELAGATCLVARSVADVATFFSNPI